MGLANKIDNTDKRGDLRHKCEAFLKWSYFNKEIYFDGKLINFSESGVYFETDHDLKPGATIFMKMEIDSLIKFNFLDHDGPRSVSMGEVKWRIDLSGNDQSCYGIGVRYPFPT